MAKKRKKTRYVAYNKMYVRGKSLGRAYVVDSGTNKEVLRKKVKKYNAGWNRQKSSKQYKAKLFTIKRK